MPLFSVAEVANLSKPERKAYENSLKYYRDMVGVVDTAREEGREQGRQEGRRDEKLTIAQTLKNAGTSLDFIAQVTGLSLADLKTLE